MSLTPEKAPEIAALAEQVRAHLADEGALDWTVETRELYLLRSHELLKALPTPLPIAPQETMREASENDCIKILAEEITAALWQKEFATKDDETAARYKATIRAMQRAYGLGQSHSPATVERELVEALARIKTALRVIHERLHECADNFDAVAYLYGPKDKALATASQPVAEWPKPQVCSVYHSRAIGMACTDCGHPKEAHATTPPPDRAPVTEGSGCVFCDLNIAKKQAGLGFYHEIFAANPGGSKATKLILCPLEAALAALEDAK